LSIFYEDDDNTNTKTKVQTDLLYLMLLMRVATQWAKSPKKRSIGVYFWPYGTVVWVPN